MFKDHHDEIDDPLELVLAEMELRHHPVHKTYQKDLAKRALAIIRQVLGPPQRGPQHGHGCAA
jgi:hypothetical protein